jgi:HEAT repeat protein
MYAPLGGQVLHVDRYRLPPSYNNAVFDPALKLEPSGSAVVACGELLAVRPEPEIHDFRIEAPRLLLKFTSSVWHVLEWLFDRDNLRAVQANDAALSTTQLRVAAYLLGRLGHVSSVVPLKQLADHEIPNVRWAAIQNLGRLSAVEARAKLEQARQDVHPHIRRAAEKSLALNPPPKIAK